MADPTSLTVHQYDDLAAVLSLREDWNSLLADSSMPNIFLTWEWITTWWKWFGGGKQLRLIVVWEGSRIIGILPVYIGRISLFPFIKFDGVFFVGDGGPLCPDYLSPIIKEQDISRVSKIMAEALLENSKEYKVIKFSNILLSSKPMEVLLNNLGRIFYIQKSAGVRCPFKPLPSDYTTFLSGLSSKRRKALRWMTKKIFRQHKVTLEHHTALDQVTDAFEKMTDIFNKSRRGRTSNQGFNRKDYLGFHQEVAKAFAQRGWLRIYILLFDTVPVAFIYGYYYDRKFWFYQTSFDSTFNQDSPGNIILQMAIESLIKEGAREFDFLRGEEDYKYIYAPQERRTTTVALWEQRGMIFGVVTLHQHIMQLLKKGLKRITKGKEP